MGPKSSKNSYSGPKALSVLGSKPRLALYYQNVAMSTYYPVTDVSTGGRSKGRQTKALVLGAECCLCPGPNCRYIG